MRITVLGKSPSWPDAGGACSGYLVQDDGTCVLVDCGSGVFSRLRLVHEYAEVDAVVISHMHADHFLDLIPYGAALTLAPRARDAARVQLLLPPGGHEAVRTVATAGGQEQLVERAFDIREYEVAVPERVGGLRVSFQPVPHFVSTNAIQISSDEGGGRFTFGADHGPTDALCGFADDSDLLMLEATLSEPDSSPRGHLTAAEAGEHATRLNAVRLVLTHISDELDADAALAAAQATYAGPVEVARTGAVYTV